MRTTRIAAALVLAAALTAGGCGEGNGPEPDMGGGGDSLIPEPTFSAIQANLFDLACNFSNSCHNSVGKEGGLELTDLMTSCAELINVPAEAPGAEAQGLLRVVPGDAEASFFYQKLAAPEEKLGNFMDDPLLTLGDRMPDGSPPLNAATLAVIAEWINSGASCD